MEKQADPGMPADYELDRQFKDIKSKIERQDQKKRSRVIAPRPRVKKQVKEETEEKKPSHFFEDRSKRIESEQDREHDAKDFVKKLRQEKL